MLIDTKARVGVFAIALGAYLPQFPSLVPEFEGQYAAFKKTIPASVELIDGGIVTTKELAMAAGDKFRAADVDLVILQLLTYATSYNMLPAVRDLDVPVVLVNVQKKRAPDYASTDTPTWLGELYACGAVGEMVADLERAGKRHAVLTADLDLLYIPSPEKVDEVLRLAPKKTESLPSVDLNVKDLRYGSYRLGSLDVVAQNKGEGLNAYWDMTRFELTNDEMKLTATGRWNAGRGTHSKTTVEATADIRDLGEVLDRFNLTQVINDGAGQVHAQLDWQGAPIDFNTESLNGNLSVAMASGQILQVEPGAGRLISLLSLQTLLRRLTLDFRDVIGQGFVFDNIASSSSITNGMMRSNNFRMIGPQATVLGEGWLDLNSLTQNYTVTVLPDISLGSAALALTVANPILGVGSFLAQWALQAPLSQLFSVQYEITGTIDEPVITKIESAKTSQSLPSTP